MAGRTLTPFGMFAKWVLLPAALAAAGFYLLGPRMGSLMPSMSSGAQADDGALGAKANTFTAPEIALDRAPASRYGDGPEVEVTAKQKRASHRRKRANPVVVEEDTGKQPASDYAATN
jgi:hypothetical protein